MASFLAFEFGEFSVYEVIDRLTGNRLAIRNSRIAATRVADKVDLAYGAICCFVRFVE